MLNSDPERTTDDTARATKKKKLEFRRQKQVNVFDCISGSLTHDFNPNQVSSTQPSMTLLSPSMTLLSTGQRVDVVRRRQQCRETSDVRETDAVPISRADRQTRVARREAVAPTVDQRARASTATTCARVRMTRSPCFALVHRSEM